MMGGGGVVRPWLRWVGGGNSSDRSVERAKRDRRTDVPKMFQLFGQR